MPNCGFNIGLTGQMSVGRFRIAPGHFIVNDRVPVVVTQRLRNVIFAGPAAELEFPDDIDFVRVGGIHVWLHEQMEKRKNPCVRLMTHGLCKSAGNDLLSP